MGLAKILFEKFPHADVYAERVPFVKGTQYSVPGTIEVRGDGADLENRGVVNLMGQDRGGKPKSKAQKERRAEWFASGLQAIAEMDHLESIAFPFKIGCGIAGGSWPRFRAMIEDLAAARPDVRVVIVSLPPKDQQNWSNVLDQQKREAGYKVRRR